MNSIMINFIADKFGGMPPEIFSLRSLEFLSFHYQGIQSVPPEIKRLKHLKRIGFSHSPFLAALPAEIGSLPLTSKYQ